MKRKRITKPISLMLIVAMLVQMIVVPGLFNGNMEVQAAGAEDAIVYEEGLNYSAIDALLGTDVWGREDVEITAESPKISDGVVKMDDRDGLRFNWTEVDGVGEYDANKTYTFEFDVTVTNLGDGSVVPGDTNGSMTRVLYVAPGGWFNQIEIHDKNGQVRAGAYKTVDPSTYTNENLHVKLEWTGTTIASEIVKENGEVLVSGSRTSDDYANIGVRNGAMTFLALRCEDGEVEIDNFSFTDGTVIYKQNFEPYYLSTEQWEVEIQDRPGRIPKLTGDAVRMDALDSIQFNWTKVDGVGEFDANKTYTFEFDTKLVDVNKSARMFYVAPGGYYNQVELPFSGNLAQIRAGDTKKDYDVSTLTGKTLHVELAWKGSTITSTVYGENDEELVAGYRTSPDFGDPSRENWKKYMQFWVLRCENGSVEIDNFSFSVDGTVMYSENFDMGLNPMDAMHATSMWGVGGRKSDAKAPVISGDTIKMYSRNSLQFKWPNVSGVGAYDSTSRYIFEFDAVVRSKGNNKYWDSESHTRVLYVANGAYFTQVDIYDNYGLVRAAAHNDYSKTFNDATFLNNTVHIKVEWKGNEIKSTITDAQGNVVVSGSRTSNDFTNMTANENAMQDITLRCEDGAIDISNFKFTKVQEYVTAEQSISIPEGKQAVYECDVTYSAGSEAFLKMSGKTADAADASGELFKISDAGMAIGGYACAGAFGEGTYGVKIQMNPTQQAAMVEVTLPNGGVIRRGADTLLYNCTSITQMMAAWKNAENAVSNVQLTYEDINSNDYELNTTEPIYEDFEANVYNLVTAFDVDAKTTRTFAWTALEDFIGDDAMAVQYRVKGASEWQSVDAVKEAEDVEYETEDYFKADITGLTAGTSYEYRIGKKNSTDETNDWSKIYTFTTEAENVNNFSFVAIGDTQGSNWNGTAGGADTRGFMYAQAALKQAIAETGNPAFILHTGDITEHGTKQSHWNGYFMALGDYGKTIPHFAAIGNHDVWSTSSDATSGSADNFDLHFNHPNNGGSAAFAKGTVEAVTAKGNQAATSLVNNLDETTYSFNYGNTHFVVLNTGEYDSAAGPIDKIIIEAQTEWLINDLEANEDAEWTIIMMHEPLYHRFEAYNRLGGIHQVIEKYGVDLAILGHSHLVTRTYPMKNGQIVSKNVADEIEAGIGTVYSTIGATTPSHDKYGPDSNGAGIIESMHTTFTPAKDQPTYTTVSVNAGEIKVTIKQIDGLVVDEFVIFKEAQEFSGVTLELDGKIGVNFYVPKHHGLSDDAFVEFKLEDGETQNVSIKDAKETKYGVKFTCWIPAKEMADEITATLYDGGAMKDKVSTSVKAYAETIISASDDNADYAKAKPLVNAMLNYGAYAQKLFGHNTENLANNNDKVVDDIETVKESDLEQYAKETQGLPGFGSLVGTSLILKGETKLKMFFEFEAGVLLEDLTFSINGVPQEYTISGGRYVVEIADISAHQLDKDYTVTVSNGNYSFEATTSAMTYCYNALINKDEADLHNVVKALYLYNQKADAYKNASN